MCWTYRRNHCEEVRVADIAPSPYTARTTDDIDHERFIKETIQLEYPSAIRWFIHV